jgi:hypothetical protein
MGDEGLSMSGPANRLGRLLVLAALIVAAPPVRADEPATVAPPPAAVPDPVKMTVRDPNRLEWAPFPVVGGNTDMGLMLGIQPIVAKFDPAYSPYKYRVQAQFAMSLKWWDGRGLYVPVHMDFLRIDVPSLLGGRLRLWIYAEYNQRNNSGYFGLGNASRFEWPSTDPSAGPVVTPNRQRYQYRQFEPLLRVNLRYRLLEHLYVMTGARVLWERSDVYTNSALWKDRNVVRGLQDHVALQLAAGVTYDTRNHEYTPSRGFLCEAQVRVSPGMGTNLHFGGLTLDGRSYVPLYGEYLVLASRIFTDLLFGNVPFYELSRASAFENREYPGGRDGFRGVPEGRYHGKIKIGADIELRSMFWTFYMFGERFRLGALVLADVGRVWADYQPNPVLDGHGAGIKFGTGVGIRVQVGETVLARFDFSYSPDSAATGVPIGIYADLNHVF